MQNARATATVGQTAEAGPEDRASARPSLSEGTERARRHAVFMVQLNFDESGGVSRTRVADQDSDNAEEWPGWNAPRIIEFLMRHAGIQGCTGRVESPPAAAGNRRAVVSTPIVAPEAGTARPDRRRGRPAAVVQVRVLHEGKLQARQPDSPRATTLAGVGEAIEFRIVADLSATAGLSGDAVPYTAKVFASGFGGIASHTVAHIRGNVVAQSESVMLVRGQFDKPGIYQLSAVAEAGEGALRCLVAVEDGGLFQVR